MVQVETQRNRKGKKNFYKIGTVGDNIKEIKDLADSMVLSVKSVTDKAVRGKLTLCIGGDQKLNSSEIPMPAIAMEQSVKKFHRKHWEKTKQGHHENNNANKK